ncbi:hypothetical protein NIES4106_30900 [Fischerella sp. NIES-4106]|nr:hypothetical protein NIES4106_30900 [Fischerella sp. NIES-4106]
MLMTTKEWNIQLLNQYLVPSPSDVRNRTPGTTTVGSPKSAFGYTNLSLPKQTNEKSKLLKSRR